MCDIICYFIVNIRYMLETSKFENQYVESKNSKYIKYLKSPYQI